MAISGRLTRKLYETFGQEAGEDLVSWMQGVDTQRWEFRELHEATTARFESRVGEATAQLRQEIQRLDSKIVETAAGLRQDMSDLRLEMRVGFARLEATIEQRHASLMKWSFGFWIGSVAAGSAAIAALDQFLHH